MNSNTGLACVTAEPWAWEPEAGLQMDPRALEAGDSLPAGWPRPQLLRLGDWEAGEEGEIRGEPSGELGPGMAAGPWWGPGVGALALASAGLLGSARLRGNAGM